MPKDKADEDAIPKKNARVAELLTEIRNRRGNTGTHPTNEKALEQVHKFEEDQNKSLPKPSMASAKGEDIDRLALLDGLTELNNHRTFLKELKAELNRAQRYNHPLSLAMIAVDNLADVAQQFGPLTVDAVLKIIANVIQASIRDVDFAARYNAGQFVVILPQTNSAGAALFAERLRQRIANQAISFNWQNFSVTSSVGVASFPAIAPTYDELIAASIQALEFAVERGGDRVFAA